jgi:hypothetical protein
MHHISLAIELLKGAQQNLSTRYTGLTDELSRLAVDSNTKFVVISNLTRTLLGLTETAGIPKAGVVDGSPALFALMLLSNLSL